MNERELRLMQAAAGFALLATVILASCVAVGPARMALPLEHVAAGQWQQVSGIGGGRKGRFTVGDYHGSFQRSATRLAFFDTLYERFDAQTRFTLEGPTLPAALTATCRMRERSITIGIVQFSPKRMAYRCEFNGPQGTEPAWMELQEQRESLSSIGREQRLGEVSFTPALLQIRSTHALEGTTLPLRQPAGYLFGAADPGIAAVELLGKPRVFMGDNLEVQQRHAVLAASLALALLWEPGE